MTDLKTDIRRILERHHGREAAITSKEMAEMLETQDRRVKEAIRLLIAEGLPVAAVTSQPAGYFIARTDLEAREYSSEMLGRLKENARRVKDFRHAYELYHQPAEQIRMM